METNKANESPLRGIETLYPELKEAEQREAAANLAAYIDVICRIHERMRKIDRSGPAR